MAEQTAGIFQLRSNAAFTPGGSKNALYVRGGTLTGISTVNGNVHLGSAPGDAADVSISPGIYNDDGTIQVGNLNITYNLHYYSAHAITNIYINAGGNITQVCVTGYARATALRGPGFLAAPAIGSRRPNRL